MVTLSCEPGTLIARGAEVRTQTLRTLRAGAENTREEAHRFGGTVRDSAGDPVAGAWVGLPESGRFAVTDARGYFVIEDVAARLPEAERARARRRRSGGADRRARQPRRYRPG